MSNKQDTEKVLALTTMALEQLMEWRDQTEDLDSKIASHIAEFRYIIARARKALNEVDDGFPTELREASSAIGMAMAEDHARKVTKEID